jgi:3-oxoacid CoA-transferase
MSKLFPSAAAAVADVFSGATVGVAAFGPMRNRPTDLVEALSQRPGIKDLTAVVISFRYVEELASAGQLGRLVTSFGGSAYNTRNASAALIRSGALVFEPCPQGIMAERLRAGAAGIPAFYSPVGVDTLVAAGKERRRFGDRDFILEAAIRPDFGFVRAMKADESGNLGGLGSTINFHPTMAAASRVTIAEVDEIVPVGAIAPEEVRVPAIYVDRIVQHDRSRDADRETDDIRFAVRQPRPPDDDRPGLSPELMALRAAQLLKPGQYVNLGIGIPVLVGSFVGPESGVMLHGENGIIGYGPQPGDDEDAWFYYDAQGRPVSILPGASFFSSLEAFTMGRGGHLDVVILGGLQVSAHGDLANWWAPYMAAGAMGGAMDLCTDVPELIVLMEHVTRDGKPKILERCTYPLTAAGCVTRVITDLALIEVTPEGLRLRELAPGVTPAYVQERTEARLTVAPDCREMAL